MMTFNKQAFMPASPWYMPFPGCAQFWINLNSDPITLMAVPVKEVHKLWEDC